MEEGRKKKKGRQKGLDGKGIKNQRGKKPELEGIEKRTNGERNKELMGKGKKNFRGRKTQL